MSGEEVPVRLGVSSCLLGNAVRYDGGHKRNHFVADELARCVEWVVVCPEAEAGLGVPRPAMRLSRVAGKLQLVEIESGRDHTRALERFSASRVRELRALDLCGFVLKQGSPSCGVAERPGRGLFAAALMAALPDLPIEDEARLDHPGLREDFIERVFAYRRLRGLLGGRWSNAREFMAALEKPATPV